MEDKEVPTCMYIDMTIGKDGRYYRGVLKSELKMVFEE